LSIPWVGLDCPAASTEASTVVYLSDANLRAVLTVLVMRLGGEVLLTNEELYHAMMPESGIAERFIIEETAGGVRVAVRDSYRAEHE
jgi:hypothetical protein